MGDVFCVGKKMLCIHLVQVGSLCDPLEVVENVDPSIEYTYIYIYIYVGIGESQKRVGNWSNFPVDFYAQFM